MGCSASKGRRPGKRTLEDDESAQTDEASDISSTTSHEIKPATKQIARVWLEIARRRMSLYRTRIDNRELMTPVFGLDTPGFGVLDDSLIRSF